MKKHNKAKFGLCRRVSRARSGVVSQPVNIELAYVLARLGMSYNEYVREFRGQ